jgi:hypothetical protein
MGAQALNRRKRRFPARAVKAANAMALLFGRQEADDGGGPSCGATLSFWKKMTAMTARWLCKSLQP